MAQYRKRPVVIEAERLLGYTEGLPGGRVYEWMVGHGAKPFPEGADFTMTQDEGGPAYMLINTLEGTMRADVWDWIIRGVAGEFYPCRDDIFAATYEEV